jgi:hypothetical protein
MRDSSTHKRPRSRARRQTTDGTTAVAVSVALCTAVGGSKYVPGIRSATVSFETPVAPVARRVPVRCRFSGAQREMEQAFVLAFDERRVKTGLITVRRLGIGGGPGLVLLTDKRLCLLVHYAFRPDRGLEFPRGSLAGVRRINLIGPVWYVRLNYRTAEGLAHSDISDVQVRTAATARMGQPMKAQRLFEAVQGAWGTQAPAFEPR